jgi:hypothetical protein
MNDNRIPIPGELNKIDKTYEQEVLSDLGIIRDTLLKFSDNQRDPFSDVGIENLKSKSSGKKPGGKIESKNTNKFLEGIKEKVAEGMEAGKKGLDTAYKQGVKSLLGPLNLITSPLEELTGKKFADYFNPFGDSKKYKGNLSRHKIKEIDPGIVWFWDQQEKKINDEKKGSKIDEFLKKFGWAGGLGSLLKLAGIGAGIALLAGGLIWATIDAIMGVLKAKQWGVSKFAGGMGGFLAGTGSGWSNAFKNAGKWALIGAGTGMLAAGPIGALAGGIIGASIGLVLGWIGGEIVAKNVDRVGKEFSTLWKDKKKSLFDKLFGSFDIGIQAYMDGLTGFLAAIPTMIFSIFQRDPKKIKAFQEGAADIIKGIASLSPANFIKHSIKNFSKDISTFFSKENKKPILKKLADLGFGFISNGIKTMWGMVKDFGNLKIIKEKFIPWIKEFAPKIWDGIKKGLGDAIEGIDKTLKGGVNFVGDLLKTVSTAIGNFFVSGFNKVRNNPFMRFVEDVVKGFGEFFKPVIRFFEFGAQKIAQSKNILVGIGEVIGDTVSGGKAFKSFNETADTEEFNKRFKDANANKDMQALKDLQEEVSKKTNVKDSNKAYQDSMIALNKALVEEIKLNKFTVTTNNINSSDKRKDFKYGY